MLTRAARTAIPVTLLLAFVFLLAQPSHSQQAAVRIMPLGDSITGSPGCWRALLWNRLQSSGFTNIDFVGTLGPQGCGQPYDGDNEGHGGALVTNVANQNQLTGWLAATTPDIVLMHFGTNDVWNGIPPATILAAYSTLVDQMRASKPTMKILVAQIIPMNPSNCAGCAQRVVALNSAIPGWASGKGTAQSPITVVDQWTGFSTASDTGDGVHPNASGDLKMSNRWFPALSAALTSGPTTTGPTTSTTTTTTRPTTTTTSTTTTGPPGGCRVTYAFQSVWQDGFVANLTVTNLATTTINGWTVRWTFNNNAQITNIWNATRTQTGQAVAATNLDYNPTIGANGGSQTFGFQASYSGTAPTRPTSITLNNTACTVV